MNCSHREIKQLEEFVKAVENDGGSIRFSEWFYDSVFDVEPILNEFILDILKDFLERYR